MYFEYILGLYITSYVFLRPSITLRCIERRGTKMTLSNQMPNLTKKRQNDVDVVLTSRATSRNKMADAYRKSALIVGKNELFPRLCDK